MKLTLLNKKGRSSSLMGTSILILITFLQLLLTSSPLVSGLKCYECHSRQPGCDSNVAATNSFLKECDKRAIACHMFSVEYDFVIGSIFHRGCLYREDYYCFDFYKSTDYDNRNNYNFKNGDKLYHYDYAESVNCLKELRKDHNLSAPPLPDHPPMERGTLLVGRWKDQNLSLSNGQNRSEWYSSHGVTFSFSSSPNWQRIINRTSTRNGSCSCCYDVIPRNDIGGDVDFIDKVGETYIPPNCRILETFPCDCRNGYGCATIWELRKFHPNGDPTAIDTISTVWRGCWYPGDQACIHRPKKRNGSGARAKGRSNTELKHRELSEDTACGKAFKQRLYGYNLYHIEWSGVKFETVEQYNDYVQCRLDVRKSIDIGTDYAPLELSLRNETTIKEGFAIVRYYFCGPMFGDCNANRQYSYNVGLRPEQHSYEEDDKNRKEGRGPRPVYIPQTSGGDGNPTTTTTTQKPEVEVTGYEEDYGMPGCYSQGKSGAPVCKGLSSKWLIAILAAFVLMISATNSGSTTLLVN